VRQLRARGRRCGHHPARTHTLTAPEGRIVFDLVDPYVVSGEADLSYETRNRVRATVVETEPPDYYAGAEKA
jgi:hypothetical protein